MTAATVRSSGSGAEQDGIGVRRDFHRVRFRGLPIHDGAPALAVADQFHDARFFAAGAGDGDFAFHGWRSSCSRRPADFQRDSSVVEILPPDCSLRVSCHSAAAMAAMSKSEEKSFAAVRGLRKSSSSQVV